MAGTAEGRSIINTWQRRPAGTSERHSGQSGMMLLTQQHCVRLLRAPYLMPLQMKHLKYDYVDRGLGKLSNATSTAYYRVIDWPSAQVGVAAAGW